MWWHQRGWIAPQAYAEAALRNPAIYVFLRTSWLKVYAPHHNIDRHYSYREALDLARDLEQQHVHPKAVRSLRRAADRLQGGRHNTVTTRREEPT